MNKKYLPPVIIAGALIAISAIPQGLWSERWEERQTTAEQLALAERLKDLPDKFGDWVSEEVPMDEKSREVAKIVGDFSRTFHNKRHPDQVVSIMIACGYGRDMVKHTPDHCYIASGFNKADDERDYPIDMRPTAAKLLTCRFRKEAPGQGPQNIRVFWSFSDNGEWIAPSTRAEISTRPAIYKIYATTNLRSDARETPDQSNAVPFLREFMPLVNKALFPPAATSPAMPDEKAAESLPLATNTTTPPTESAPATN